MTRPRQPPPLGDALQPTIDRLKEIASHAGAVPLIVDAVLPPDHDLLDLCSEFLHLTKRAKELRGIAEEMPSGPVHAASWREHMEAAIALEDKATSLIRRARKMRATTPAGIYAKALAVRCSRSGAAALAVSLAEELIACQPLRASLWPAQVAEGV